MTHFIIKYCMDHRHTKDNLSMTNPWMGIYPVRKSKSSPSRLTVHSALSLKWVILINNSVVMIFIEQYDLFLINTFWLVWIMQQTCISMWVRWK